MLILPKVDWTNVSTNLAAIAVYAQTAYPGLSGEQIVEAFHKGTLIPAAINLALMWFLVGVKGRRPNLPEN